MKSFLFLLLLGILLFLSGTSLYLAPIHLYKIALSDGINSEFLKIKKYPMPMYQGGEYEMVKMVGLYGEEHSLWKKFHFGDYELMLPLRNPLYLTVPTFEIKNKKTYPGISLLSNNKLEIARATVRRSFNLKRNLGEGVIFSLPIFKKFILSKTDIEIWQDIFLKKINPITIDFFDPVATYRHIQSQSYRELVYNLFILSMRENFFPAEVSDIKFISKQNIGVVESQDVFKKTSSVSNYRYETVYILERGSVYTISLRTRLDNLKAEAYRIRFLKNIDFRLSSEEAAISIYAEFRQLPIDRKEDQEGLTYLFAAWTHMQDGEAYFREMISYLERRKNNRLHLIPLYDYSLKRYGTNFSKYEYSLEESLQRKLQRKVSEELADNIMKLEKLDGGSSDGKFESAEQKVNFLLQKAKDSQKNTDVDEKLLIVD